MRSTQGGVGQEKPERWAAIECSRYCQRALTQKRTLGARGGGALEVGDHRLLEDGSKRGGALDSNEVGFETASEGWDGDVERVGVSMDRKANALGRRGALKRGHCAPLEPLAQLGDALGGVGTVTENINAAELVTGQAAKGRRSVNGPVDTKGHSVGRRRTPAP